MARLHPDVDHEVPLPELRAEAADLAERAPRISRDELLVGLLRLTTLGERDGHGGIFLHDPAHTKPFTSSRSACTTSPTASTSSPTSPAARTSASA